MLEEIKCKQYIPENGKKKNENKKSICNWSYERPTQKMEKRIDALNTNKLQFRFN